MLDNYWYIGCASSQLPADRPVAAQIGNHQLALFRDSNGHPRALLDRCCHRGYPLSRGSLHEGHLRCGFHGWEFDSEGKCVRIPSQPATAKMRREFGVPQFSCREQDSYVWVWVGDAEPAELVGIPEAVKGRWAQGSMIVKCNCLRALEIAFDMSHAYYVHPGHPATMQAKKFGFVHERFELRGTRDGCVVFNPPAASEQEPIPSRASTVEFRLPGTVRFALRTAGAGFFYMYFYVIPITERSCRMEWLVADMMPPTSPERIHWDDGGDNAREDRSVLELIQATYEREGEAFEHSVDSDAPTLRLRELFAAATAGTWNNGDFAGNRRRIFHVEIPADAPRADAISASA